MSNRNRIIPSLFKQRVNMKIYKVFVLLFILGVQSNAVAGDKDKEASIAIVNSIIGICQEKGMLSCQPYMKGIDFVFDYIRLFDQVSELDKKFKEFVKKKYPKEDGFDFDVIQASLVLSIDITMNPDQFVTRITDVNKVKNGYDVTLDNGPVLQLRKQGESWIAIFPQEVNGQFKRFQPLYMAGQLKRSILIYRMLEAEMANLTKDELEENISKDIAPILVALFPKEKFSIIAKWLVKDVNEVIKFYSQFSNIDELSAHIIKVHKLL